jgi:hypothetical protein
MPTHAPRLQGRRPFLARTLLATALTAAAIVFGAPGASAAAEPGLEKGVPDPAACQPIDFSRAFVRKSDAFPHDLVLVVSGYKPSSNMDVVLSPLVYIRQPEYWEIEVQGCARGIGLPVLTPYTATLRLGGTIGSKGIEVVGATRRQRIEIPSRPIVLES